MNKSSETSPTTDFNLPIGRLTNRGSITSPFTSLLEITDNYVGGTMPYYGSGTQQDTLNNNQNGVLPNSNDYILRPYNHYPRLQGIILDQTGGNMHGVHPTYNNNGFHVPVNNNISPPPPTTTSQFQLMPHLMNSFI